MKCKTPFRAGLLEAGCGHCLPCRINRQRLWTIRIVLEAGQHSHSSYVTLTYGEDRLPSDGSVSVRALQLFFKRLRRAVGPFRYYGVGEYGERSWRPHYHAILFGVRDGHGVEDAWKDGFVHVSGVGPESAAYVAGYCLKGLHNESGMRWAGKQLRPEFSVMSRNPGLGVAAAERLVQFYSSKEGSAALLSHGVGNVLRYQRKKWPLGRFLSGKVKDGLGIDLEKMSEVRQLQSRQALRSLSQVELNDLVERNSFKSLTSGQRAEARAKRMALERKL